MGIDRSDKSRWPCGDWTYNWAESQISLSQRPGYEGFWLNGQNLVLAFGTSPAVWPEKLARLPSQVYAVHVFNIGTPLMTLEQVNDVRRMMRGISPCDTNLSLKDYERRLAHIGTVEAAQRINESASAWSLKNLAPTFTAIDYASAEWRVAAHARVDCGIAPEVGSPLLDDKQLKEQFMNETQQRFEVGQTWLWRIDGEWQPVVIQAVSEDRRFVDIGDGKTPHWVFVDDAQIGARITPVTKVEPVVIHKKPRFSLTPWQIVKYGGIIWLAWKLQLLAHVGLLLQSMNVNIPDWIRCSVLP